MSIQHEIEDIKTRLAALELQQQAQEYLIMFGQMQTIQQLVQVPI